MKRTHLFLALVIAGLVVSLVPADAPAAMVQAQGEPDYAYNWYIPYIESWEYTRLVERFDTDPGWEQVLPKDPKDGWFEHAPGTKTLVGNVTDNSALMLTWPGWFTRGDFKLEVDARHVGPLRKSFNGLGLVFNLRIDEENPRDHHFYALMIAMGAAQNFWSLVRFDDTRATYETNDGYRGGPNFMRDWDGWNHLEVRVIDGYITVYCNGKPLPGRQLPVEGKYLADGRLVGLVATSYEFDNAVVEFDNFELTPLYPGDPEYDEVIQMIEARAQLSEVQFDTPPLDLHK
jgi:hypothetical protein